MPGTSSPAVPALLRLYLLGPFRVETEAGPIPLRTRKVESLLAYLALHPEPHAREKLAALLWGDSPDPQARHSLRLALNFLRKALGADIILADRESVQLNPSRACWVDAREFQISDVSVQLGELSPAEVSKLQAVSELYCGDLLVDFYDDWIAPEREQYRARYLERLLRLTQHMRAHSEYARAVHFALKVLDADPANEKAHQHLMFCYVATGERSAALEQYETCRRALREELAVEPSPETTALYDWIRQSAPAGARAARITNLPLPLTSFVGREHQSSELKQLLRSAGARLLTLTGAGGCGKTRLAIQVAADLLDEFKDGVWWVDLAPLADAALVPQAVAKALGVREAANAAMSETLANALRSSSLLLVLDNCEHLAGACARLSEELLGACRALRILATSREALELSGEIVVQVPPLSLPAAGHVPPLTALSRYEAIRLFAERVAAIKPGFELSETAAPSVTRICQQLDGMPLAIELAAARVDVLTVEQIAERLDERQALLTPSSRNSLARHQTMRAAIEWSYKLLLQQEQVLFRRLAVFAGGFTREAAEYVSQGTSVQPRDQTTAGSQASLSDSGLWTMLLLSRLADRSLLLMETRDGAARYRLLETIREYAREQLTAAGEESASKDRHLAFYMNLVEAAAPKLSGAEQMQWLDRLELEHDNLRAALEYAQAQPAQAEIALQLAGALERFWNMRGHYQEGRARLMSVLALPEAQSKTSRRAQALQGLSDLTLLQADYAAARTFIEQTLALQRELDNKPGIGTALQLLGIVVHEQGDDGQARALFEEELAIFQGVGDKVAMAKALNNLGHLYMHQGERGWESARSYLESSLALLQEVGNRQVMAFVLHNLGEIARGQGDLARARALHEQCLAIRRALGDKPRVAWSLSRLGRVVLQQGDDTEVEMLLAESETLFRETGERLGLADVLKDQSYAALRRGERVQAAALGCECLRLFKDIGARPGMGGGLIALACIATATGEAARAARLFGAVEALFATLETALDPLDRSVYLHYLADARSRLGELEFGSALAEGRAMPLAQAVEYALEVDSGRNGDAH